MYECCEGHCTVVLLISYGSSGEVLGTMSFNDSAIGAESAINDLLSGACPVCDNWKMEDTGNGGR